MPRVTRTPSLDLMTPIGSIPILSLRRWVDGRAFTVVPVAVIAAMGVATIALKASQGPRSSHIYWLSLVLSESAVALLLRRRHPTAALAGVLATYLVFDFPAISAAPVLLALFTVSLVSRRAKTSAWRC